MYSQFLRMYTSKSVGTLTLVLGSQVRMDLGSFIPTAKDTGGNAIKHYNILTVEMKKISIQSAGVWPSTIASAAAAPKNSFPVQYKIIKSKMMNRYKGCALVAYFYIGELNRKFNILAIAKKLELTDGKKYGDLTFKGFNDMVTRIDDETINEIETKLIQAYTDFAMGTKEETEESDEVIVINPDTEESND